MTDHTEDMALPPFEAEFARAWDAPGRTRYQLPDTDVNQVLASIDGSRVNVRATVNAVRTSR